jgi:hypothetical protein
MKTLIFTRELSDKEFENYFLDFKSSSRYRLILIIIKFYYD